MRAVNLLPPDRQQAASKSPLTPFARRPIFAAAGAVVVVAALLVGILTHSAASSVGHNRRQLAQVERELTAAQTSQHAISESALATASARRATVLSLARRRLSWDGFLGNVALVIPEDVWLVSLSANPTGAAAPATSASATSTSTAASADTPFAINGYTYSQSSVARLLDRLALIPWLQDVQLKSATLTPLGNRSAFQFSIGASMTTAGGVS